MWHFQTGRHLRLGGALVLLAAVACGSVPRSGGREAVRLPELLGDGDPARRASQRLLIEGLEADARGDAPRAKGRYERAVQVDPMNPYAYLVFARHEIDRRRPAQAEAFLDQARALFDTGGGVPPNVEAHLLGLQGASAALQGQRSLAAPDLRQAADLSPAVWGDAYLAAQELL